MLLAGFVLILMLMVTVIYNDLTRISWSRTPHALALKLHDFLMEVVVQLMRFSGPAILAFVLAAGSAQPAVAQSSVTTADIQRLQDNIYDAARDVTDVRSRDSVMASQLQTELDEAREEATYLKVKLRRNEPIAQSEYADVRDRSKISEPRARNRDRELHARPPRTPTRVASGIPIAGPNRPIDHRDRGPVAESERDSSRHRARRAAARHAQLQDGAGRGSLRGDDDGRPCATSGITCSSPRVR